MPCIYLLSIDRCQNVQYYTALPSTEHYKLWIYEVYFHQVQMLFCCVLTCWLQIYYLVLIAQLMLRECLRVFLNLFVFVLINQFLTIYDFSFIFCLSFMSAFLFSYLDWVSIASRIHHSKLNLTDYSAKWDDNFYLDINRSVAEREENITPCSYHNAVISQNCVRMMKCTYLCCKI